MILLQSFSLVVLGVVCFVMGRVYEQRRCDADLQLLAEEFAYQIREHQAAIKDLR